MISGGACGSQYDGSFSVTLNVMAAFMMVLFMSALLYAFCGGPVTRALVYMYTEYES